MTQTEETPDEMQVPIDPAATIHERMIAILDRLPAIGKTSLNTQQKFHYRGHDDVLNALNPLLAIYGVYLVPRVLDRVTAQRETRSGGILYEVSLLVEYTFYGMKGDSITASAWGEGTDSGDKSTNKAMTMSFKNVIAQAFAISTQESQTLDTDGTTDEETTRAFDPSRDLLPDAIKGADAIPLIGKALTAIDPTIEWAGTLQPLIKGVFAVESRQEIPAGRVPEFWRRLSNAIARMGDPGLFPSPPDTKILAALKWAFNDVDTVIMLNESVAAAEAALSAEATAAMDRESGDEIPFGDVPVPDTTPFDEPTVQDPPDA